MAALMISSERLAWPARSGENVPSAFTPTVPLTAMEFPLRMARQ
jgi:hypothetical protein